MRQLQCRTHKFDCRALSKQRIFDSPGNPHKLIGGVPFAFNPRGYLMRTPIKSLFALLTVCIALSSTTAFAKKVAGIELVPSVSVGTQELALNGAGIRKKLFIKLYVGSLYLATQSSDANAIITADESMMIRLNILSGLLTQKKLTKALKDGFKNSTGGNTAPIQSEIDQMLELMQEKIVPGDIYALAYEPGVGTHVLRNDEELSIVPGLAFKNALFGIWLSDKPAQASLKKAMLAK